jgi:uroporphyrin-III C-methyltransferase
LALARPSAEKIFMGKPLGRHCSRQDEIHDLLVHKAREGKTVVRLKGGDPFLFGRGGEEAEYLAEHGIPFEAVPGVSSCLSAPLSAGIAVTHRDRASSVAIVTGHQASEHDDRVDWQALSKVDTLVVLMGVHNIEPIARKLMAAGLAPDTPAAIVQMAFWESERVIASTLGTIAEDARHAAIEPPATLVIGEAVRLREKLKHQQQHIGQDANRDPLIHPVPVPVPDRPPGDTLSLDTLSLEEESCIDSALSEKEVLQ